MPFLNNVFQVAFAGYISRRPPGGNKPTDEYSARLILYRNECWSDALRVSSTGRKMDNPSTWDTATRVRGEYPSAAGRYTCKVPGVYVFLNVLFYPSDARW